MFKEGDIVVRLPGFHLIFLSTDDRTYGGAGYKDGKIFKIYREDLIYNKDIACYFEKDSDYGVYYWSLKLADESEIYLYEMGIKNINEIKDFKTIYSTIK